MSNSGVICILSAIKTEARPFIRALEHLKVSNCGQLIIYEGYLVGKRIALTHSGAGLKKASAAAQALLESYDTSCFVMSGTAGGMDKRLEIGDTAIAVDMVYHDMPSETVYKSDSGLLDLCRKAIERDPPGHTVHFGRIASGNSFIKTKNRETIIERFNPLCVDMETTAVADVCLSAGIPFIAVRSVTDTEKKSGFLVFFKNARRASRHSFIVVKKLLAQL